MSDQAPDQFTKQQIPELAAQIAGQLGETKYVPIKQIEAEGGLMLPDSSRRHTPGGVFFRLVRERVDKPTKSAIFYYRPKRKKKPKQQPSAQSEATAPTLQEPSPPAQPKPTAPPQHKPPALPPAQQLQALQRAEGEARERLDAIKELPPEEQVGLSAVLRELKDIKEEIRLLRQKHPELRCF